ncbi:MAG: SixA phosphatase family protein [Gaiellaceae bacterium]
MNAAHRVFLIRHAFADHADPLRWPDDADRPLTSEGADRFRSAARGLGRLVAEVDAVLASYWARAWQTAELLRDEAGWPEPVRCGPLEPGQSLYDLIEELRARHGTVALVGHEPALSRLTSLLCSGSEDAVRIELKKGGVVLLDVYGPVEPARAILRWVLAPKILRALDPG